MKWQIGTGINTYIAQLNTLISLESETCGKAIYSAAGIVADEVRKNIEAIPKATHSGSVTRGITDEQRQGLLDGFGISHERTDGEFRHVKLGMDGYNDTRTKKYPQGQPNAMIARVVESGSEYHKKTPFISKAVRATKEQAEGKMAEVIDESIHAIFREE